MNENSVRKILKLVSDGQLSVDEATNSLKHFSTENLEYANIDHNRSLRKGFPEVIYGEGKTAEQIIGILKTILKQENLTLVTRISKEKADIITPLFKTAEYHEDARMLTCIKSDIKIKSKGKILIVSAGTSDIPVAKEAFLTAKLMGNHVEAVYDVGVAGIHRLFEHKDKLNSAKVIVVVAGMEGALPSVIAGLVKAPVIAVPTSVGYGTSFGGITALFSMLNCCSSNVAVVNIDNGFGGGFMASSINQA